MASASNPTALPSFVELMSSLGLDPTARGGLSPKSSPCPSPPALHIPSSSPTRSRSSPSLRDATISRNKIARYSPYSPTAPESRRGSLSSTCSSSPELERASLRANSTSPRPRNSLSSGRKRRFDHKLSVNVYGSSSDLSLAANTPISSFVRRKISPAASPTSPTFSICESSPSDSSPSPSYRTMPFTIPTLPSFFPLTSSSYTFPPTPGSDVMEFPGQQRTSPNFKIKPLPDVFVDPGYTPRYHNGIRVSSATSVIPTPPRSASSDISMADRPSHSHQRIVHVA